MENQQDDAFLKILLQNDISVVQSASADEKVDSVAVHSALRIVQSTMPISGATFRQAAAIIFKWDMQGLNLWETL
jgi:hypothetical protein